MTTLSLCMIVKNEEQFLEQCLNSVKNLVDEIIIVDTGSIDKTKEIASKFTEKIFDFQWCDDFSAARNESLKHATKDWILILDADELVTKEEYLKIKEAISNAEVGGYSILTKNYSLNSSLSGWQSCSPGKYTFNFPGWYPSVKIRLFRNKKNFYFIGRIHEMIKFDTEEKLDFPLLLVAIHHYGELKDSEGKKKEYLRLLIKKVEENPNDAKAHFELGVQYKEKEENNLAEKELKLSVELNPLPVEPRLNLALVQQRQNNYKEAKKNYLSLLEKPLPMFIASEVLFGLGMCFFCELDLIQAANYFKKVIQLNPSSLDAYVNLGAIYEKQGFYDKAQAELSKALQLSPQNPRTYYNLGVLHEKQLHLELALRCYQRALELDYVKEGLKERIEKIKLLLRD
ncbi:MAG: tetratricopeptide repeat protein [Candidatus Woesearchaeota archaeon]